MVVGELSQDVGQARDATVSADENAGGLGAPTKSRPDRRDRSARVEASIVVPGCRDLHQQIFDEPPAAIESSPAARGAQGAPPSGPGR